MSVFNKSLKTPDKKKCVLNNTFVFNLTFTTACPKLKMKRFPIYLCQKNLPCIIRSMMVRFFGFLGGTTLYLWTLIDFLTTKHFKAVDEIFVVSGLVSC